MKKRAWNAKPERAEAIHALQRRLGWKPAKIAAALDMKEPRVRNILINLDWREEAE
jgi:hypothetical protein